MRFFRSIDTRLRSDLYSKNGSLRFCLIENTQNGMLVTEFNESGFVEKQVYAGPGDDSYSAFADSADIVEAGRYSGIKVDAECKACGGEIARELDLLHPSAISHVPVVPMFICRKCGKRFYSMTDNYLRELVSGKKELFEEKDLKELAENESGFTSALQEYIIRIFASKKISRIG